MSKILLIIGAMAGFPLLFVATASFLLKAKMIFILVPVVIVFTIVFVGMGIFFTAFKSAV